MRKLSVLVTYLPPESATATAMRLAIRDTGEQGPAPDPSEAPWSAVEMLLASIVDELRWMRYEYRQVNSENAGNPPQPVPRPGTVKKRKQLTMEQRMRLDPRMRKEANGDG